jgi:hypothetical protein
LYTQQRWCGVPGQISSHFDRADPGLDRTRRAVTMPHHTGAPVGELQILHRGKKRLDFNLDGLQLPRTSAKDIRPWIVDRIGLAKRENVGSLIHGVSLFAPAPGIGASLKTLAFGFGENVAALASSEPPHDDARPVIGRTLKMRCARDWAPTESAPPVSITPRGDLP